MIGRPKILVLIPVYIVVLSCLILIGIAAGKGVDAFNKMENGITRQIVVIDAGHGYPDGGATSCSGKLESEINLQIALRLDDLMHLLGIQTVMVRSTSESIYTQGNSISAKKISDLRNRVKLVNDIQDPILISIHQNYFQENKYSGAQVFYNNNDDSKILANEMQNAFVKHLNPDSKRRPKRGEGIYLLESVKCTCVLVECGFLSNPREEFLLSDKEYQNKICSVVATCISQYISATV